MSNHGFKLGYLARCTLLALGASLTVPLAITAANAADEPAQEINIPAQNAASALLELAEEANVQIIFSPEALRSVNAPAIAGQLTVSEAIQRILSNTQLEFVKQNDTLYVVRDRNNSSDSTETAETDRVERIQVVGSNIRGARSAGALPVTSLNEEDIINTNAMSGDELLRSIPQIGDVAFNNERVIGGVNDARGDVSSINLRGIGTGYTLTTLNGRRLVLHPGTQTENFVPVATVNSNTLPVRGLARLEVLRDGAAAIYGSDAIAGVVNYVLKDDVDTTEISVSHGGTDGTNFAQTTINALTGLRFNDGRTYLSLSGAYYNRDGMMASERSYSASLDTRFHPGVPERFQGAGALDGRLLASPWGTFWSPSNGTFHLLPSDQGNCSIAIDDNVCGAGGSLPTDWRYDAAVERSMTSDVERFNVFGYLTHEISATTELFAEALWYSAESIRLREQNANLAAQRFTIAADAAYNPFGEDVEIRNIRPTDTGPRRIVVEDYSYRLLTGLRGMHQNWDWESAVLYSLANTLDTDRNRIRADAFQAAINQTDPNLAYNPFIGGDPLNPNTGIGPRNAQSVIDTFTVDVTRESETELALWDFKVSSPDALYWYAGDIGMAAGVEFRYESYSDKRDPLLSGEIPQFDLVTGDLLSDSNALGSSATPSASGSREVYSAFLELDVPLHETVNMQLAARFESFSDVGSVTKPKVALSWAPHDMVQFRAAYAEGFRAPNLPQVVEDGVVRSNTRYDPLLDQRYGVAEIRGGNTDLEPEESKHLSYGVALAPVQNMLITVDFWDIEQKGIVGILNSQTHLLYDAYLRANGEVNPAIVRDEDGFVSHVVNTYSNLNPRSIAGMDVMFNYRFDTDYGRFDFRVNVAQLKKFEQTPDPISALVLREQAAGNPAVPDNIAVLGAGDLLAINGNPEWRANASLNWRYNQWNVNGRMNYIGRFASTWVRTSDGEDLPIPVWRTYDLNASYQFSEGSKLGNTRLRVGVRNLTDKAPPVTSGSFGYVSDVHSNRGRYIFGDITYRF
ncbi:TonB-dependent receptor [Aliidiomarina haloalkalitolerans]|uniref:TonB-dependent receptor n=1 Tax=Aliidiomarina haloalkalitolerans TaxID=859059 RepID=A0A432VR10_9GAMM|nr:TonB-dependent receptor [Aliidiomarina haloalkalitolerans]RUO18687.1 TonB-dependent receptor [Aliidiomarina haloalkalitolerans]